MKVQKSSYAKGVISGILGSSTFATYLLINRYAYINYPVNILNYTFTFLIAGGFFALIALSYRRFKAKDKVKINREIWPIAFNGFVATLGIGLFIFGLGYTTAINTSILATSTVITTVLFSRILLGEKLNRVQFGWFMVMFLGFYVAIVGFDPVHLNKGDLIVISACVAMGFANTFSKMLMKSYSNQFVADGRLVSGAFICVLFGIILSGSDFIVTSAGLWPVLAGFFFWLTIRLFYASINFINPTQAIVLTNCHPIVTPIIGVWLLGEPYALTKLLGSVLLLISIYFITKSNALKT